MENKTNWRRHYLDGEISHSEFYLSIARDLGIGFGGSHMELEVRKALADGDENLNSIPLKKWDGLAASYLHPVRAREVFKAHGDSVSLAGMVCTLKAAARRDCI